MVSTLLWVRSLFGILVMPLIGLGVLLIAYRGSRWLKDFSIQFLGVQACISTFQQVGYLFTSPTRVYCKSICFCPIGCGVRQFRS